MARYIQAVALCLCMVGSTCADGLVHQGHTPPQSPFHATGPETIEWPRQFVEYEGRATLSAKYRFVFDEENGFEQNPHLFLMPDVEAQSQLPYLTRGMNASEKADEIWVTNVAEAGLALLGKQLAEEVLAGKHQKVTGEAIVVIEGFSAGYECDSPSFATRFVEVQREISAPSVTTRGVGGC